MPDVSLRRDRRYEATVALGMLQSFASNDMIANLFANAGFSSVEVTGSGTTRTATGLWVSADTTLSLPEEVASVRELPSFEA